jgi:hypothetical protein
VPGCSPSNDPTSRFGCFRCPPSQASPLSVGGASRYSGKHEADEGPQDHPYSAYARPRGYPGGSEEARPRHRVASDEVSLSAEDVLAIAETEGVSPTGPDVDSTSASPRMSPPHEYAALAEANLLDLTRPLVCNLAALIRCRLTWPLGNSCPKLPGPSPGMPNPGARTGAALECRCRHVPFARGIRGF